MSKPSTAVIEPVGRDLGLLDLPVIPLWLVTNNNWWLPG